MNENIQLLEFFDNNVSHSHRELPLFALFTFCFVFLFSLHFFSREVAFVICSMLDIIIVCFAHKAFYSMQLYLLSARLGHGNPSAGIIQALGSS